MKWLDAAERMDNYVIKKDSTSTDSDYFMATHVPFQKLEYISSGDMSLESKQLSEEDVYHSFFVNHAVHHQMIMVRGTNGTGKSHLICWLHNRLINDKAHYNPEKEQVVFLRRLRNTSRGAIQQMLDAGLIQDPDLQEKFVKFVNASLSQDEDEFKTTIYHAFIGKVSTDKSKEYYNPIKCKNIASFLSDSRVQEYFLSEGGPITRCYRTITGGVNPTDGTTKATFESSDFKFPRDLIRKIRSDAATEVSGFYLEELKDDDNAIASLVAYLNHFTSAVIQSCANITSENIRELFENLRRNLKKEGKRLTILIEDFTSFSIVDSELITALAVEPGGEYHDLCPVTSVIGITDGHYDSFRDNFKDRVFNQISVTEQSFSDDAFIVEMAARYLNAIYCDKDQIRNWYESGALQQELPISSFRPSFAWDSVTIGPQVFTLYPFTRKSLITLFSHLKERKPRHFLDTVIRQIFRQFADGMGKSEWYFPELPPNISNVPMSNIYASSVEESSLSDIDKRRLKVLFAIWGDGTSKNQGTFIGEVPKVFLSEIKLGDFSGLGQGDPSPRDPTPPPEPPIPPVPTPSVIDPRKEALFKKQEEDIQSWFDADSPLRYDDDYFKWISTFILNGIPWQDEGIPAFFVTQRQRSGNFVMIEGSEKSILPESVVAYLKKTSETRNILIGLATFNLHGCWNFPGASYYQYVLVTWLERNKAQFKKNICGDSIGQAEQPIVTWCLALEYLQRLLNGEVIDQSSDKALLQQLLTKSAASSEYSIRSNTLWNDTVSGINNSQATYAQIRGYLVNGANSTMSIVGDGVAPSARIFRYSELLNSLQHLRQKDWNISDELQDIQVPRQFAGIVKTLQGLYSKIDTLVSKEKELAQNSISKFQDVLGAPPTQDNLVALSNEISQFYVQCNHCNQPYKSDLKAQFDDEPSVFAKRVGGYYQSVERSIQSNSSIQLLQSFSGNPTKRLDTITANLKDLEIFVDSTKKQYENIPGQTPIDIATSDAAQDKMNAALDILESWEA